eukprot:scaffold190891_cov26-Tisochrysis_lutea.AAC.5
MHLTTTLDASHSHGMHPCFALPLGNTHHISLRNDRRHEEREGGSRRRERGSRLEGGSSIAPTTAVTAMGSMASRDMAGVAPLSRRGSSAMHTADAAGLPAGGFRHGVQPARNHNCYALLLRAAGGQALPAESGAAVVRVFRHLHAYDLLARCVELSTQ